MGFLFKKKILRVICTFLNKNEEETFPFQNKKKLSIKNK